MESMLTWVCGLRDDVSSPFDVFGFVCFGDLCWDHTQLSRQKLEVGDNGQKESDSFELDSK